MTINVALVTTDALILGCDSVASTSKTVIEPWRFLDREQDGTAKLDADGKIVARFDYSAYTTVVTDVWSGVTKMFELCREGSKIAATTAGLAALNDRSMSNLAAQFLQEIHGAPGSDQVEEVVKRFLGFMRAAYDQHYEGEAIPDEFKEEIEFLIGGYGVGDHFPSLYRVQTKSNKYEEVYKEGKCGAAWAGQADGVSRLIFGYDHRLKFRAQREAAKAIDKFYDEFSTATAKILEDVLQALGKDLPAGISAELPAKPQVDFPWGDFQLDIEFQNLPLQDAVDCVSYLVNLQSGRAKFVRGVATVGGRTHIGVLTRTRDFRMLSEPEIIHRNTGFPLDL